MTDRYAIVYRDGLVGISRTRKDSDRMLCKLSEDGPGDDFDARPAYRLHVLEKPEDCRNGCPANQVCDYCQKTWRSDADLADAK